MPRIELSFEVGDRYCDADEKCLILVYAYRKFCPVFRVSLEEESFGDASLAIRCKECVKAYPSQTLFENRP